MRLTQPIRHSRLGPLVSYGICYLILIVAGLIFVVPYLLAALASLKQLNQMFSEPPLTLPHPYAWHNFVELFQQDNFGRFLLNTVIVAVSIALGQVLFCSMAAYAFARMEFPGKNFLFVVFLSTLMVPNIVTTVPLFIIVRDAGMLNTLPALILPYVSSSAFGVFLMRQFFLRIPEDLISAAKIDGASSMQVLTRVIVPLSRPVLMTFGIMSFVFGWNNFLWPLIATNSDSARVLTVAISAFQSSSGTQWNLLIAGSIFSLLPLVVLFLIFQRYILSSVQLSGFR
ncbi:MAG: binding-protein-dependent transport system inner rane component [Acidimicrobiaceae bacterium]|jgi:multiple sugar transport system permease protein|nr:binding-protein-dependent transport system inner rane component [Acidimicrobiaceae bacterium]